MHNKSHQPTPQEIEQAKAQWETAKQDGNKHDIARYYKRYMALVRASVSNS